MEVVTITDLLSQNIGCIKGIGQARAKLLNKMDIYTVEDMLYHFPRAYEDRTILKKVIEVADSETVCIKATISSKVVAKRINKSLTVYSLVLRDETGLIYAVWYNQRYLMRQFHVGETYIFYGKISIKYSKKQVLNPIFEKPGKNKYTQKIVPQYPLTARLTQKIVQSTIENCIQSLNNGMIEYLPQWIRQDYKLIGINEALKNIHFPVDKESFLKARYRLVFQEFLLLQLGLLYIRHDIKEQKGLKFLPVPTLKNFIGGLPFSLTKAQVRVMEEIIEDLQSDIPMNRLLQGDVGSGKTIVAALAMYVAVKNHYQTALMVPTEILAEQHFRSFQELFKNKNICLLTGSTNKKEKDQTIENIKSGIVDMVIGTHALIQENIEFLNLGLVVTDEQHRFGVKQRSTLVSKGNVPHVLIMTATPIPRTLSLILYGDMDISVIDELPPGRQKIDTFAVSESFRNRVYSFVRKQVQKGRQAYIVCPLVEESEQMSEMIAATTFAEKLKNTIFSDMKVGLLHGKLKSAEKEKIMRAFVRGDTEILVATTVIEVGVDVPNATVMIVENAERFGLSQLHQLRGRVGRGADKSYCILFSKGHSKICIERMKIMQKTNDGFKIAEKDLELRGPGDFFGTRQHGLPNLKIANIFQDLPILKEAQEVANKVVVQDIKLQKSENSLLKQEMLRLFDSASF